ncbi:MAG: TIGR02450 family Trp-rich protein [Gammaproteobacteria bacterium]|nr:TIGR02450 family Trp-rich protein [Gammaproteobacteria bacterium]
MNRINPNKLLNSKWTAVQPVNRQRHFIVTKVLKVDDGSVTACVIEALLTREVTKIDWRKLKDSSQWAMGWK